MAVTFNLDGQAYSFPDWATESTQGQIKDILTAMAKNTGVSDATLKKLLKSTDDLVNNLKDEHKETKNRDEDQQKRDDQALKASRELGTNMKEFSKEMSEFGDNLEAPKGFFGRVRSNLESDGEQLGAAFGQVSEVIIASAAGAAAVIGGVGAYVFGKLTEAGGTINDLTKVGVGFNTTYSDLGMSTTQAIGYMGALGVGFDGAAKLIAKNSAVVATAGFGRFNDTMKFAADVSENLGMSFEDSMETFGDALSRRQKIINLGNVDQNRVNQTIRTTVKTQMAYATALGASTEELQAFVDSLVQDNGLLTASLLSMSDTVKNDVVAGIEVFASGMAAMGGKAGQDIAAAFLEAGAAGAVGLSDAAVGIVTALPELRGPMNDFISGIQDGTLSQEDANAMVQNVTKDLANLSDSEKQRIQLMARTGDESAKMMANAIAQFEQSENKLKDINKALGTGFNMDAVQQGTNNFNKIMAQVSGGASNAFYSLFADPGVLKLIEDGLKEIMGAFGFGVDSMSGIAQEGGRELGQKFLPMLKSAVGFITDQLKAVAEYVKSFKDSSGNIDFGALFDDVFSKVKSAVIGTLIKGVAMFAVGLFGFSMAKEFAKSILMPQLKSFMGSVFSKEGASKAAGMLKTGAGKIAEVAGPKAGKLMESVQGSKYGKMASEKLGTVIGKSDDLTGAVMGKGAGLTDKLEGAVSGGGGGTGFLKKIADGVKEFGDTKVVKGAASLVILAGALTVAAIGFKTFNDVNWDSLVKGGLAIGGLVLLAKQLGSGSTGMIKGAAAIAILGASVIPLAVGLQLMDDVGLITIINLAAALTTLGVAGAVLGKLVSQLIPGAIAIAALGASILPLAIALNIMKDVGLGTIGVLAAGLVTLGIASIGLGMALPFVLLGSVALAALGVALLPLSLGLALAGVGMAAFAGGLQTIQDLSMLEIIGSLLGLGAAMTALLLFVPSMLLTAVALSAVGVALLPFAATVAIAGAGISALSAGLKDLQDLNILDVVGSILALGTAFTFMLPFIPGLILTSAALSVAGIAMLPFALAAHAVASGLKAIGDIDILDAVGSLVALGAAFTIMIPFIPGLLLTSVALSAAGVAMLPFAAAALLVAPATMLMAKALGMLADISILDAVGSLLALGIAMNAMLIFIPGMLIASAAMAAIGIALLPFALGATVGGAAAGVLASGLKSLAEVPLLSLTGGLLALSLGMVAVAALSPFMMIAGAALAAFGVILLPFAAGAAIAGAALESFNPQMKQLSKINWLNMIAAGPALMSLAAGMIALSAGGLVSGLIDGIGKLFGSNSPFDKLATIGDNAKHIVQMAEELRNFGDTMSIFEDALAELDSQAIGDKFYTIADSIYAMQSAINGLDIGSIAKLATLKLLGLTPKEPEAEPEPKRPNNRIREFMMEDDFDTESAPAKESQPNDTMPKNKFERSRDAMSRREAQLERIGNRKQSENLNAYKDTNRTAVDQTAVPTVSQIPQDAQQPATQQATTAAKSAKRSMSSEESVQTQEDLLKDIRTLLGEANRLAKKTKGSIENIDV